ncbi:MAG: hypothetical protein HQ542_02650 [Bacteroidia bacterium]|nr:hypothetical protein [Bacteroidia bacterium]
MARTNVGLLSKAVELLIEKKQVDIYFEGRIESYTYADDGASVYDVLNLYLDQHHLIKDKLIATMKHFHELEEYVEKTEDAALRLMVEIVKKYHRNLSVYIRQIKDAGKLWSIEEDDQLTVLYCEHKKIKTIANRLGRTQGAIRVRIEKLELKELYD